MVAVLSALLGTRLISGAATITAASVSQADVQAAVNSAVNGDTVMIPNGSATWASGIATTKQIIIRAQNYTPTPAGTAGTGATSRSVTIVNNSSSPLFSLTTGSSFHCGLAGIAFVDGTGSGAHFLIRGSGSKVALVSDLYMTTKDRAWPEQQPIVWEALGGVLWNIVADATATSSPVGGVGTIGGGMLIKSDRAWNSPSTLGALDVSGTVNVYVEDSTFINCSQWPDIDDNGRFVARRCVFNGTWGLTHGFTSLSGGRHFEYYDNVFSTTSNDRNISERYFWCRAGTGVFTDNVVNNAANPSLWGAPEQLDLGDNTSPGTYPQARQPGWGYDGTRSAIDPIYLWNQTGARAYTWGVQSAWVSAIQENREIYVNKGAKPGYAKFTYPHPLRTGGVVTSTPPQIVASPVSATISQGQPANFSVSVAGSSPFGFQWQKNTANIAGATTSTYTIASAQTNDAANYRCVVTNAYGIATSAAATLTVTVPTPVPASIVTGPASLSVSAGQSASFAVTAAGTAPLAYQWQKNSANISGATASTYTITSAQTNDAANYRCVVTNAYGSAVSTAAALTVSGASTGNLRYVDFSAGNDSNPGTAASPWKRCPGMVGWAGTATLLPGDTVYFDRSDAWDIPQNLSGAGFDLKAGVHYIGNAWNPQSGGGVRAVFRATGRHEAGVVRIWEDHATLPTWIEGFEVNANGQRASLIDINHAFWKTGLTKAVKRVENCLAYGNSGDGSQNDYKYGIVISDNSPDASGWVANVEILNTVIHTIPRDGFCMYPGSSGMISNIVIRGCEVYDTGNDPSYSEGHGYLIKGNVKNSVVEFSYAHDVNSSAVFFNGPETGTGPGPSGCAVRYNVLQTADNNGVVRLYGTGSKSADIYGNVILPNEATGGLSFSGNSGTHAVKVYNNTFYNAFVDIGSPTSTGTIEFKNNIVYELDDTPLNDPAAKITAHSNNLFYRVGGGTRVSRGGTSYSASNLASFETGALSANPNFKNASILPTGFTGTPGVDRAPNSDGLALQVGSPGIDGGAALSAGFVGSVNSVLRPAGAGWDIGAYEYRVSGQQPAPPSNLTVLQ